MPFGVLAGLLFGHILGEDLASPIGQPPRRNGTDGRDATSLMKEYGGGYWKRRREAEQERLSKSASVPLTTSDTLEKAIEIPGDDERGASRAHSGNSSNNTAPPSGTSSMTENPANPVVRPKSTRRRPSRGSHTAPTDSFINQPLVPSPSDSSSYSTSSTSSSTSPTSSSASSNAQTATEDTSTSSVAQPSQTDSLAHPTAPAPESAPTGFRRSKRTAATRGAAFITSLSPNSAPWSAPTQAPTSSNSQTPQTSGVSASTPLAHEEGDIRHTSQNANKTAYSNSHQPSTTQSATNIVGEGHSDEDIAKQNDGVNPSNAGLSPRVPSSSSSNSILKDFKCVVCLDNVVDPTATFCGHVFCEACIIASIEANHRCPTCRCKLSLQEIHPLFI